VSGESGGARYGLEGRPKGRESAEGGANGSLPRSDTYAGGESAGASHFVETSSSLFQRGFDGDKRGESN